jgi:hypothetical protein
MHTMTQGTQSISMAHRAALGCLAVARQLSVVVMMVSIVALVAGTAGTSYAKSKKKVTPEDRQLEDTVVVTNFGSLFAGSVETFAAGSILTSGPIRRIIGSHTLIGAGNGASGDAQSSLDGDIAVTVPLGVPGLCPSGCLFVWPAGANGNSAPEEIIGGPPGSTPGGPLGFPVLNNNTGLFLDQGVAFDDPFREIGVHNAKTTPSQLISSTDLIAVANFGQVVLATLADPLESCDGDIPDEETGEEDAPTIGTITFYQGEQTGNVFPTPAFLTLEIPFPPAAPVPFWSESSIGGCDTVLAGPLGLVFDTSGNLWVVNELGKFVTEYEAGDVGDAEPINIVSLPPVTGTTAFLKDPAYIAVGTDPINSTGDQVIYVTDVGDNSIKIFDVSVPFTDNLIGTISGGHTKLVRPEGIFLSGDDLYVVNNNANSLEMFDDLATSGAGNISPKLIIKGSASKMNFPVGVAGPQFTQLF